MREILIPILTLGGLGLIFGVGLAIAAKKLCAAGDPRLENILTHLPGANCGACGMAGCIGFAEGLIQGQCSVERCGVTDEENRQEIAKILGVEAKPKVKRVAVLHCNGGNKVKDKFIYKGIPDCIAANLLQGGQKACVYGCLGFGTCVKACPFGAIAMGNDGLPVVIEDKCTACGKCVQACPKKLFSLIPRDKKFYVACSSQDFGKAVLDVCPVGCITCGKCVRACPVKAMSLKDNLAVFDYKICQNYGECCKVCPTHAILKREG